MPRGRQLRRVAIAVATSLTLIVGTVPQVVGTATAEEREDSPSVSLVDTVPAPCSPAEATPADDLADAGAPSGEASDRASGEPTAESTLAPSVEPSALTLDADPSPVVEATPVSSPSLDARSLETDASLPAVVTQEPTITASDSPSSESSPIASADVEPSLSDPATEPGSPSPSPTATVSSTASATAPSTASASPTASRTATPSQVGAVCVEAVADAVATPGDMSVSLSWLVPDGADDTYVTVSDGRIYRVPAPLAELQVSGLRNGTGPRSHCRPPTMPGAGPR